MEHGGQLPAALLLDNFFLARAQAQAAVVLYPADAATFPAISSFMDVFDVSGRFVSGILPEQVTVFEDDQPLPLTSLTEMVVPLQLAVAINPGPALGVRDNQGKQRFEGIVEALSAWAQALPSDTRRHEPKRLRAHHFARQRQGLAREPAGIPPGFQRHHAKSADSSDRDRNSFCTSSARGHEARRVLHHAAHGRCRDRLTYGAAHRVGHPEQRQSVRLVLGYRAVYRHSQCPGFQHAGDPDRRRLLCGRSSAALSRP
jgi:hypothetical protein